MLIRSIKAIALISSLLMVNLGIASVAVAENADAINIQEYHQILDAINKSDVPDDVKNQLFRDMKTTLIENIRQAKIPDDIKHRLIQDLETTTRK